MNNYYNKRQKLVDIFNDTKEYYSTDSILINLVNNSKQNTIIYQENSYPDISNHPIHSNTMIEVNKLRSFECAINEQSKSPNSKICVMNFASSTNPGGGVEKGSSAQEEALCRCSTLYPTLIQSKCYNNFYNVNRRLKDRLHTDAIIYSPNIQIIKTDEQYPRRLNKDQFITVDILSCAAPNLRDRSSYADFDTGDFISINNDQLYSIHLKRAKHILHIAAVYNVDIFITGAFGCGAFQNDPIVVAKAYNDALKDYKQYFEKIIFAVYCNNYEKYNFDVFNRTIIR